MLGFDGRGVVRAENKRPPLKRAHERTGSFSMVEGWWGRKTSRHHQKRARMLVFDGGGVVVAENKGPPSKTSLRTRFRWWRGGEGGKQAAAIENRRHHPSTIENEPVRSFSMVGGGKKRPPSQANMRARFRCWRGGGGGKQVTAIENERACLFQRRRGGGGRKQATAIENGRSVVVAKKQSPSNTSICLWSFSMSTAFPMQQGGDNLACR